MIELFGEVGSPEYEAATRVRDAMIRYWPGIEQSTREEDHIKIIPNVKLSGQKISDIDIVLIGLLKTKRYVIAKANARDSAGNNLVGAKVRVRSFLLAIEVKDQDASGLDIKAGGVSVRYRDGWKNATEQNDKQLYALRNYIKQTESVDPWTYRCLMLRGIPELPRYRGVPQPSAGTVAANFDAGSLLMAAALVTEISKRGQEYVISSADDGAMEHLLETPLFKSLEVTALDRKRMDRISARPRDAQEISKLLGKERVHLRGHGGTGKTILMLQSAYDAYLDRGVRTLILTYNNALVADIERTLALMGIPSDGESGGITVRTIMSFMCSWFARLELVEAEELDLSAYNTTCADAVKLLDGGAVNRADLAKIKSRAPIDFDFDAIFVDEAQDCPQSEADLLTKLYGTQTISLANGLSQLVRGAATNWDGSGSSSEGDEARRLRDGLRMKHSLCAFANKLAQEAGVQWHVTPNAQAPGGRVILSNKRYEDLHDLQQEIMRKAVQSGNMPIDLLHCVPPSGTRVDHGKQRSNLADVFAASSWDSWDAVDSETRRTFPRLTNLLRIVQYDSCRGLEGWSVILDGLDEFWEQKRRSALKELGDTVMAEEQAKAIAWRWAMIPLTRPIDTLVITLRDKQSEVSRAIAEVAADLEDVVQSW